MIVLVVFVLVHLDIFSLVQCLGGCLAWLCFGMDWGIFGLMVEKGGFGMFWGVNIGFRAFEGLRFWSFLFWWLEVGFGVVLFWYVLRFFGSVIQRLGFTHFWFGYFFGAVFGGLVQIWEVFRVFHEVYVFFNVLTAERICFGTFYF